MDIATLLEEWFALHEDGECVTPKKPAAYLVIAPSTAEGRYIYCTKRASAQLARDQSEACAALGLITPLYGLPCAADAAWLNRTLADHEVWFLGDLDPTDLLIFAWLRARLAPKPIEYCGISDAYLRALKVSVPRSHIQTCSPSEQESFALLAQAFGDYRETVGERCARVLDRGQKVELEAVVSALGSAATLLLPACGEPHA